mmetsp:Transcript_6319/g.19072  ORF Transcript_6319/g.19072 Transcript_6319/m.19072 type:complete len:286 (+) Transcript_6319:97-954(+)|eukprot:CAMPEP_0198728882 /NCGR_PEP_ID=MMETSP1475-20131203/11888_1 /TAXON_ID= ORGANISM="Unidentified sp., Strain CCMP1999" /NCGR_SAMPLE_ID=MMETSP1475 /ASSEMBLY_ACC=CAM_ASM_001111 /LENGTH=285 /DNA_ID=CAMNT_0044491357 /DNA_START=39 /DNA_END=896 /DNA_ORIENTATION=+
MAASVTVEKMVDAGEPPERILSLIRRASLRVPRLAVSLKDAWFARGRVSRSAETWDLLEMLAYACADVADWGGFDACVRKIFSAFGAIWRVNRLFGIKKEARGELDQAAVVYENILYRDPLNSAAIKRQVAWFKTSNMLAEASAHLSWYLSIYTTDVDAWCELADLYTTIGQYSKAIYCLCEAVIYDEKNWAVYLALADVYYTIGDEENMLNARRYYAKSLTLNLSSNVRALYGLMLCTSALESSSRSQEQKNKQLKQFAQRGLRRVYQDNNKDLLSALTFLLDA